jgi:hypothetical protein
VEGKGIQQRGIEEAPENGKESLHSAHANGISEYLKMKCIQVACVVRLFALIPLSVYIASKCTTAHFWFNALWLAARWDSAGSK